ncbi:MAG: helix-turn-helix domain-containing protein [Oribacterium sp.]|nr:helix-turn-helix domain-containing protein [Oribacterium sp.]
MRIRSVETKERIKKYAEKFFLENRRSPSSGEVAEALGMVKSTVYRYLIEMDEDGMIRYDKRKGRTAMAEKTEEEKPEGKSYEYMQGDYRVTVSFSGEESLEDCLARYVKKRLERHAKKF